MAFDPKKFVEKRKKQASLAFDPDEFVSEKQIEKYGFKKAPYTPDVGVSPEEWEELQKRSFELAGEEKERQKGIKVPGVKRIASKLARQPALRGFTRGATAGLSEPVSAGISSLILKAIDPQKDLGELYEKTRGQLREEVAQMKEENPFQSAVGEIGGVLSPGGAFSRLYKGATRATQLPLMGAARAKDVPTLLRAAQLGGRGAAASGGFEALEQLADEEREGDILKTAGIGGALDAIVPGLGRSLKPVGDVSQKAAIRLLNSILKTPKKDLKAGKDLGADIFERLSELPVTTKSGLEKATGRKVAQQEERLQSLLKDTEGTVSPEDVVEEVSELKKRFNPFGKEKMGIADVADEEEVIEKALERIEGAGDLSLPEANKLKRDIYRLLQDRAYRAEGAQLPVRKDIKKAQARALRKGIERYIPEAADINKELATYGRAQEALTDALAGAERSNLLKFLQVLSGGAGFAGGGLGGAVAGAVGPAFLGSTPNKLATAKALKFLSDLSKRKPVERGASFLAPQLSGE